MSASLELPVERTTARSRRRVAVHAGAYRAKAYAVLRAEKRRVRRDVIQLAAPSYLSVGLSPIRIMS